jgi:hypothetical protein
MEKTPSSIEITSVSKITFFLKRGANRFCPFPLIKEKQRVYSLQRTEAPAKTQGITLPA